MNYKIKKSTAIRFDIENYKLIRDAGRSNNRTISGQANWMCKVVWQLEKNHPEIYAQIVHLISSIGYLNENH